MSSGGLVLAGVFLAGALALILWPLLAQPKIKDNLDAGAQSISQLQAQRETILLALRDLDFDKQTGKLNPADYNAQRERLVQSGVEILKQIDALQSTMIEEAVSTKRTTAPNERRRSSRKNKASA